MRTAGLGQRRGNGVARRVVVAVPLRDRPLHHRADALAHPAGGHALGGPDGQQHRHDVGGGDGVDALSRQARQDVVAHARAPLALGAPALPVPGVDRDYGLIGLREGGHLLHEPPGVAALGDGARVGERLLAGHGKGDHRVGAEAEAGLGAVGGDSLRPGLGEAAGLAGRDQQAQSVTAVPIPVPAGDVDGPDEGGAEANGVTFSGRDHVSSYSSVYGIYAEMQRIAAMGRESIT